MHLVVRVEPDRHLAQLGQLRVAAHDLRERDARAERRHANRRPVLRHQLQHLRQRVVVQRPHHHFPLDDGHLLAAHPADLRRCPRRCRRRASSPGSSRSSPGSISLRIFSAAEFTLPRRPGWTSTGLFGETRCRASRGRAAGGSCPSTAHRPAVPDSGRSRTMIQSPVLTFFDASRMASRMILFVFSRSLSATASTWMPLGGNLKPNRSPNRVAPP